MVAIKHGDKGSTSRSYAWLDRFLALAALFVAYQFWFKSPDPISSGSPVLGVQGKRGPCAPRKGIVIVSLLDKLGYNLLQIAFARRIADELCWDVSFRPLWNPGWGPAEEECFPNANAFMVPPNAAHAAELGINNTVWNAITYYPPNFAEMNDEWETTNKLVTNWAKELSDDNQAWRCIHPTCDFSEQAIQAGLAEIRSQKSNKRVIYFESFFMHHEWLQQARPFIQSWLEVKPTCCSRIPPPDAVVIHIHHPNTFDSRVEKLQIQAGEYERLLEKYKLRGNAIWVVCDEGCQTIPEVQDLVRLIPGSQLVHPTSAADTLCIVSHAKTLVTTPNYVLSSVAAVLTKDAVVHYPTVRNDVGLERFVMALPEWKYHVVTYGKFTEWNVPHSELNFQPSWKFG